MEPSSPVIEIQNLTKKFGDLIAVNNIDLIVEHGLIHGFLGPNGAGKTTAIRCLLGLLKPYSGTIKVFGQIMKPNNIDILKRIGYLPGEVILYPYYNVKELLDYFAKLYGKKNPPLRKDLIERFGLDEATSINALSKGNRQKVGIIQAFMHDPDLLILDEPSSGLDPLLQNEFYKVLKEFRDRGKTIFFSSHVLSEVQKVCDHVSVIRKGEIVSSEHVIELSEKIQRKIILKFNNNNQSSIPTFENLDFIRKEGEKVIYLMKGKIKEILLNLAKDPEISDIILPESSVEDYFMTFYEKRG
ncbi:MAG: putative ABC transporter ATP-binding protein YbhF [Candidatus Heimdallarchaeota archaeon LC_3]|nr:MAG: putative ABC transporter ATP-binding protein YbhF [Candidatus Heimdallarchaeota archaeon LC_3]